MSAASAEAPPISVVVAIVADHLDGLPATLAALRRQVYEPVRIAIAGGDAAARRIAGEVGAEWVSSVATVIDKADPSVSHVWVLGAGAEPRPDALRALVTEAERVEAGVAGSKLLRRDQPEQLVSVGVATDVFGSPYTGLEDGEIDAGQYDVVRDVAAVGGASLLIRRDLARGLGGPDTHLAPGAAAIDICQRARLRGGRVVVIPSSEVLVPEMLSGGWREEAGQIRSMLKVYSLITLLWAIPARLLLGLFEAIVAPFMGRWTLFRWLAAWGWNLVQLPSTIRARLTIRRHRAVGDTELFRFQLRGSAELRRLAGETGARLRERLPGDDRLSLIELGRELRQPAIVVGAVALGLVLVSTRTLWGGFPSTGFSLPLPTSGRALVGAYAGGWNPAGFGGVEPLQPFLGFAGLVQAILFDRGPLASGLLMAGAALAGVWGTTRLVRTWGVEAVPGLLAGLVLVAGPATRAIGAETGLGTLVALGALPWALRVPLARWPHTRWAQLGRLAATAWVSGIVAVGAPLLVVVAPASLIILALITPREPGPWRAALLSVLGSALTLPLLLPWAAVADLNRYVSAGDAYWEPGLALAAAVGVALLATVIAAPRRLGQVAGWGGVLAAGGGLVSRTSDLGGGREMQLAGMAVAALGSAIVVGVAFEVIRQLRLVTGWRRLVAGVGVVAAAAVTASTVLVVLPGRGGLPADDLNRVMGFTAAATGDPGSSRVLLIGPVDELPGQSRTVRGAPYRVVSAPQPALWEAWLPERGAADEAFEATLDAIIDGESFRAGDDLAQFGIRWVIFTGDTPLTTVFDGQLDLAPLDGLPAPTYASEAANPVRAVTDGGAPWRWTGTGYVGEPDATARVVISELANTRWGPARVEAGWGNDLSAADGEITFRAIASRTTQAASALGLFVVLVLLSWWGRRR